MARVLIVDDDPGIRETLRFLLEDEGYIVEEADDGAAALAFLRMSAHPLVVLLDLVMPGLNGVQLLTTVAHEPALARRHAFVIVTASSRIDALEIELQQLVGAAEPTTPALHALPPVRKPFDIDTLLAAVATAAARLATSSSAGNAHAPGTPDGAG